MKRIRQFLLLATAVAMTIYVVVCVVTGARRDERVARIEAPPALAFHERLAEATNTASEEAPPPEGFAPALDTIARWTALFDRCAQDVDEVELFYAWNHWRDSGGWDSRTESDETSIKGLLDMHQGLVDALRSAAALEGPTRAVTLSTPSEARREWSNRISDAAHLLVFDAFTRAREGDYEGATADCVAVLQLSTALASEPALYSYHGAYYVTGLAYEAIRDAFPSGALPQESLTRLLAQVRRLPGPDAFIVALQQDNLEAIRGAEASLTGGWREREQAMSAYWFADSLPDRISRFGYVSSLGRPWLNRDITYLAEDLEFRLEMARLPYYEAAPLSDARLDARWETHSSQFVVNRKSVSWEMMEHAGHERQIRLLQVGLTLEQHHLETGSYPETLSALSSSLPEATLTDPFSREYFRYETGEGAYSLYGVGSDGEDDGGARRRRGTNRGRHGGEVWRAPTQGHQGQTGDEGPKPVLLDGNGIVRTER